MPSVPWISRSQTYWAVASKLATRLAVTPDSSSIEAVVCDGVPTSKRSPARGPISIVRSRVRVEVKPATRRTGPSSATIALT